MKEKLLILDDESLILRSLEHLLEDDYEVFTTTDAEAALGLAQEHDIAVVLCDERMPGVSGHEFLAAGERSFQGHPRHDVRICRHERPHRGRE